MKRVCVVCEGQTEETFVRTVLAPAFYPLGLGLDAQTVETSPGHKGGGLKYGRVRQHLHRTLRQSSAPVVTTLLDLYRLDPGFPGFEVARKQTDLSRRLDILHRALHADVVAAADCQPDRFIPHIQPHEFEALLFSDVSTLTRVEPGWQTATATLAAVCDTAESPEHINDHPESKPAALLQRELRHPGYHKRRHGPIAAQRIGLARIEAECAFFSAWLQKIRALATSPRP